ncbi:hypothetical protein A2U01_0041942, partial [Trifolium medium]|nr:hypothetical protein [Trifolium medium]
ERLCSNVIRCPGVPARCTSGKFLSPEILEVVRPVIGLTTDAIRTLPIGGELAFMGDFGVSS